MSSPKYHVQHQPGPLTSSTGSMEDKKFHSGWMEWVIANLVLGSGFGDMLHVMKKAGFSEEYASARLDEYEQNYTVMAARKSLAGLRKAADVLDALGRLEHRSPFGKQVDVAHDLPAVDFYRDYFFRNRPVVLKGLTAEWKAMQLWTPEYFASRFGSVQVEVLTGRESDPQHEYNLDEHKTRLLMREYVRMVVEGGETNDYYLVAQNYLLSRPEFQELYGHITGMDGYLDMENITGRARIWFGPKSIITRMHHDAAPVMIAQVYGHKQVKLISPFHMNNVSPEGDWLSTLDLDHLDYDQSPRMRNVDILEVTLAPGDLLFIPLGWWHWVKGLDVTISLSIDNFQVEREEIEINWKRDQR